MKNLACFMLMFCFYSCSHYVVNQAGYIRPPKNQKFTYKKRISVLKDSSFIDTTAIYYLYNSYYKDNKEYKNRESPFSPKIYIKTKIGKMIYKEPTW